jgi:hypothetical protein
MAMGSRGAPQAGVRNDGGHLCGPTLPHTTPDNGTLARVGKVMSERLVFVYTTKIAAKTAKLL